MQSKQRKERASASTKHAKNQLKSTKKKTKSQMVLKHLKSHKKGITSMTAFEKYNVTRLSSIIFNFRRAGYDIVTIEEVGKDGVRYARYVLKEVA